MHVVYGQDSAILTHLYSSKYAMDQPFAIRLDLKGTVSREWYGIYHIRSESLDPPLSGSSLGRGRGPLYRYRSEWPADRSVNTLQKK